MKRYPYSIIYALILILSTWYCESQNTDNPSQIMTDYNLSSRINEKLTWKSSFGLRTTAPQQWSRIYIDPSISYDWPRLILKKMKYKEKLLAGLGLYYTDNERLPNQLEIRPYQGYSLSAPNWDYVVVSHTIKLEERFEISTNDWVNTFGLRFRYKGSMTFRFKGDIWEKGNGFFIPANIELYWNLIGTKQFNDRANLDFGLGKVFNEKWKALITFGYNYSKAGVDDSFDTSGMRWRLRVYHNLQ